MYKKFIAFRKLHRCLASFLIVNLFLSNFVVKANNGPEGTQNTVDASSTSTETKNIDNNQTEKISKPGQNPLAKLQNPENSLNTQQVQTDTPIMFDNLENNTNINPQRLTELQDNNSVIDIAQSVWENQQFSQNTSNTQQTVNQNEICPENDNEMVDCEITLPNNKKYNISKQRMIHIVYGDTNTTCGGHTKKSIEYRKNLKEKKDAKFEINENVEKGYTIKLKNDNTQPEKKSIFPDNWRIEEIISAIGFCLQNHVNEKVKDICRNELICSYKGTCICVITCEESKEIITAFPLNEEDYYYINPDETNTQIDIYAGTDIYKMEKDGDKFKNWSCSVVSNSEFAKDNNNPFFPKDKDNINKNMSCAVANNHLNLLESLIKKYGYDINSTNKKGDTLLTIAVKADNEKALCYLTKPFEKQIEKMIKAKYKENFKNNNQSAEKFWTLIEKDLLILSEKYLLSPFGAAVEKKNKKILEFLSKKYEDVYTNIKDYLLRVAVNNNYSEASLELVNVLLKDIPSINKGFLVSKSSWEFPEIKCERVIYSLVEKNFLALRDNNDNNYLHFIMQQGPVEVKLLHNVLDCRENETLKAIISAQNKNGETVLHIAACQNTSDDIIYLLRLIKNRDLNIDLNTETKLLGWTILHFLAYYNKEDAIRYLILNFDNNKIKNNELDNTCMTPSDLANKNIAYMIANWTVKETNNNNTFDDLTDNFDSLFNDYAS